MTTDVQQKLLKSSDELLYENMKKEISDKALQQSLERIKDWYKYQPHLPKIELDDRYLKRHLRVNKYDEEKLKQKIEALYTARTIMPQYFADRDPWSSRVSKALASLELVMMPTITEENYRVIVLKFNIDKQEDYDLEMACLCGWMLADIRLHTDCSVGDVYLWDASNFTFNQIKNIHLPSLKNIAFLLQSCYGAAIKGIHIINYPPIGELALSVVKAALKKKVADRLIIHSSRESLEKSFPVKHLPKDMGGDEPLTLKEMAVQWEKALKTPEMRQWFLHISTLKSDETKRLGKKDFLIDDLVGMRGTFRKLDLD